MVFVHVAVAANFSICVENRRIKTDRFRLELHGLLVRRVRHQIFRLRSHSNVSHASPPARPAGEEHGRVCAAVPVAIGVK